MKTLQRALLTFEFWSAVVWIASGLMAVAIWWTLTRSVTR